MLLVFVIIFSLLSLQVLSDIHAGRYIHGVAVHWYLDSVVPPDISLGTTHDLYPEYYLFGTEACAGWNPLNKGVMLGSWDRAEQYAHDIIEVRSYYLMRGGLCLFSQIHCKKRIWQAVSCSRKVSHLPSWCSAGCAHTRETAGLQAIKASWNWCLVSSFFTLFQGKLDSFHSLSFAWVNSGCRRSESPEEFVYVDVR